tara:strand:- start:2067 stop:2357 length:291 start_codon:yes stop_codon:yes gene_type:complete
MKELTLRFDDDDEFMQVMEDNEYIIHSRTLEGINNAFDTNSKEDVVIAYLNDDEYVLSIPEDCWKDNLEMSMEYFTSIEDYEKCNEIKQLIDKLNK